MKATLILIGTELLNGGTLDTNSVYMAEELNRYGIEIKYKITVGDKLEDIKEAIKIGKKNSDLVIITGGLGPTIDDITKKSIADYLGKKLTLEEKELKKIKEKFRERKIKFLDENKKEAEKIEGAICFENDVGMASGMFIDGIVCFPGVPKELYNLFPKFLKWYDEEKKLAKDKIVIKDIITYGLPESYLNNFFKHIFKEKEIEYEFLVKGYGTVIRLQSRESIKNLVEKKIKKIYNEIEDNIFGEDNDRLEKIILKKIKTKNLSFSVAESCTGGMLSSKIIEVSGASQNFKEGIVAYKNIAKMERLGVSLKTLEKYGAVSVEVAKEMVEGLKTDVGISTTGIAGPEGGTREKPVGLVYIGLKNMNTTKVIKKLFKGSRDEIREKTVLCSLFYLNKLLGEGSNKK